MHSRDFIHSLIHLIFRNLYIKYQQDDDDNTYTNKLQFNLFPVSRNVKFVKSPSKMAFFTYVGIAIISYYMVYLILFFITDCDVALTIAEKFGKKLGKLKGKIIWIVEASNNLGEAMAYEIARNNGKMVLSGLTSTQLELIKKKSLQINKSLRPEDILILPMDIRETETHKSYFNRVLNHFGSIDILINNGGKFQRSFWEDIDVHADYELFDLNVFGIISLSRIFVQYFANKGKGQIVVISSLAGLIGFPYSSSYAASLHAIHGYFESLRNEKLGKNLQISLIYPGPVAYNSQQLQLDCEVGKNTEKTKNERKVMSKERYAWLAMIAVVNKLDEAWIAPRPIIPLMYALTHFPNLMRVITNVIIPKVLVQKSK